LWLSPDDPVEIFPPVAAALREPNGLLAAGGDLSPERLLGAYRQGIFPWYDEGQPLLWWSPDPRCILQSGDYYVSRRLRRELRRSPAEVRINTAFRDVIRACAGPRRSQQGTWITADMMSAFEHLHDLGWAHSIEIWREEKLSGGLYGLGIGRMFFGESMFSITSNASKIALLVLAQMLDSGKLELVDCQMVSQHLMSLGASVIPREDFVARLISACGSGEQQTDWPDTPIRCPDLLRK
jgi:leucyl/phenylalanyl-tRNA--protein transferase